MSGPLRLRVNLTGATPPGDVLGLVELARVAEGAGVHEVCLSDHVLVADPVPAGAPLGSERVDADWPEPITVLGAIAAATTTLRIATGMLIGPLRPAALVAKQVATLDRLAPGRLSVGIGVSWQAAEYAALGVPFVERGRRLDDLLGACRALWSSAPASYASPTVTFSGMHCRPLPTERGGPPVWFGGSDTPALRRRLLTQSPFGTGWMPPPGPPPDPAGWAEISAAVPGAELTLLLPPTDAAGRPVSPGGAMDPTASWQHGQEQLVAAGASHAAVALAPWVGSTAHAQELLQELGAAAAR